MADKYHVEEVGKYSFYIVDEKGKDAPGKYGIKTYHSKDEAERDCKSLNGKDFENCSFSNGRTKATQAIENMILNRRK
jgi:hypothetical protein